jgi:competence protein ComEC
MNAFNKAPFFRILPAFCFGITASFCDWINIQFVFIFFSISILALFKVFISKKIDYKLRLYPGIVFQFIFFILGFLFNAINDDRSFENYFINKNNSEYYLAELIEKPREKNGKFRVPVVIRSTFENKVQNASSGKCFLYFKDDTVAGNLDIGDRIIFSGKPALIQSPRNPGEFDFRYFSSVHRIYYCFFLKNNSWSIHSKGNPYSLKVFSSNLRNEFLNVYKKAGITGQEYAVLSALVLGYDDEIDSDIMSAFSASGTLHILSVSGMHVGIIFAAISFLLSFMERKKQLHLPRLIILIFVLWFYAFLTGLSPSVIRSCTMFSFIIIGKTFNRTSGIYNSLSISAFCILIFFDPLMLFDVGLQLSFIAVAGISFLYNGIYNYFSFQKILFDKTWSLIAVSIAAQLATFPISIYYFHRFPNYFIIANLIIIPLSTIGIFSGILLLFLQPFNLAFELFGTLTRYIVHILNNSAIFFRELPGALSEAISISMTDMFLIYFFLLMIIFFLERKSISLLFSSLFILIVIVSNYTIKNYNKLNEYSLIVFSNTNSLCFQMTKGNMSWLFFHNVDSLKALKFSDQFLLTKNISGKFRKGISLDGFNYKPLPENIYLDRNLIFCNNILIFDDPDKNLCTKQIDSIKSGIYYFKKLSIEIPELKNAKAILVNNINVERNNNKDIKITSLHDGHYYLGL